MKFKLEVFVPVLSKDTNIGQVQACILLGHAKKQSTCNDAEHARILEDVAYSYKTYYTDTISQKLCDPA